MKSSAFRAISRPAEVRAIAPDPMLDHRQPAGQCECDIGFCLPRRLAMFIAQALSRDHLIVRVNIVLCGLVEKGSHHGVTALGDPADACYLTLPRNGGHL
jgi:hypothetical protein